MAFHRQFPTQFKNVCRLCPVPILVSPLPIVRQTVSTPGSRVEQASRVVWVPSSVVPVFPNESLTNCRRHFASVGTHCAQSFDEELLETICRRFHDIESHPIVPGLFDAVFFSVRFAACSDSMCRFPVGMDGLPYSFCSSWQNGSAEFIQPCPLLERGPHAVEAWRCGSCRQTRCQLQSAMYSMNVNKRSINLCFCFFGQSNREQLVGNELGFWTAQYSWTLTPPVCLVQPQNHECVMCAVYECGMDTQ